MYPPSYLHSKRSIAIKPKNNKDNLKYRSDKKG